MPDFTRGMATSFEIGSKAGGSGRFTGLLNYLNAIVDQRNEKAQTVKALDLLGKTETLKANIQTPKDAAMANYYNSLAKTIEGGGITGNNVNPDEMDKFGIPQEQLEDYYLKPRMIRNRGVTSSVAFPERKRDLSQKTVEDIATITSTASDLMKNLQTQEEKNFNSGPGITTRSGAVGDITAQFFRGPEFTSWKSDVGRAFQKYRKWATGVAAGYPELQILAPNFPKTTDIPEVFRQKTMSAVDDMNRNRDTFLDYLSKSNYATSQYKSIKATQNNNLLEFSSEIEAEKANLKPGTEIMINGRKAIWE